MPAPPTHLQGGAVLVVDDEPGVRALVSRALKAYGFEVEEAADGAEAICRLETRAFSAMVCDIIMPGREGVETIMEVKRRWPATFVVAMSGGGRVGPQEFLKLAAMVGADRILRKPFSSSDLAALLKPNSCAA